MLFNLQRRGELTKKKKKVKIGVCFFILISLGRHSLITLNCSKMILSPSLSRPHYQGVTTHLAIVHNSQPSHFASTTTDLVWGAISKAFRKVIVHVAIAHGSVEWQSFPQAGSESRVVMQTGSEAKIKDYYDGEHMSTWFYFLFAVTDTLKTVSCASILSSKCCQENKNKGPWMWTTHTPPMNKQSVSFLTFQSHLH